MKPFKLFFLTTLLFSIVVLTIDLISGDNTVDLNVHDTYFVIAKFHIWLVLTLFLCILTCVYFILQKANRSTNKLLTITHYLLTILPLTIIPVCINQTQTTIERYTPVRQYSDLEKGVSVETIILTLLIAFVIGQLIFIINIITSRKNYVS